MPTPVSSARQCLTDEAARALDDAVAVARRRSHSQTTSLHAVSALLSLPASTLRDACARARSSAYSPRLQFRALELCVSVSLDRLPSAKSKTLTDEPPVSNSLMAAIKRSQANQRRHPETFHFYQMQVNGSQSSLNNNIKVEIKHFILSILDDPIVSRVFGDAGFRSSDIKIAVLHPQSVSGFQKSFKYPPVFLCNLPDMNRSGININMNNINFPFAVDNVEEEFKRIGVVLAKKSCKNPLLIGVSAGSVVDGFIDGLKIGKTGYLPNEIEGLDVVEIKKEISEFVCGDLSEDLMSLKMNQLREKVEGCEKCGVIVNFGELKVVLDGVRVEYVVSRLSDLVSVCGGKLWLIGSVGSYEVYMKILAKFPGLDKEWDLNLLPVTCSKLNPNGSQLKSSLMGSFVPFGGFFPVQTELERSSSSKQDQSATRCHDCNEKYEQEVSVVLKGGKTVSVADQQSTGLASWLQVPESDSTMGTDHGGVFNARITGLQRKWSDICHRLHHNLPPQQVGSQIRDRIPFHQGQDSNQESRCRNLSPPVDFFAKTTSSLSPTISITTDLGLGTNYVSPDPNPGPPTNETRLQTFNRLGPAEIDETRKHISNEKDFKQLYRALADKVGYQNDSVRAISETITRVRTGPGRRYVWFMFSGPDPVSKKKVSSALAEVVFGSPKSLISIDLDFESQMSHAGSVFNRQSVNFSDPSFRGKTVMEFIAEELTKKPQSVVLFEHVDKADFVTKDNLSRAIRTGKLSDARGRETRITDAIFVLTTSCKEENAKEFFSYSEERILNAQALQMRIQVEKTEPRNSSLLLLPKDSVLKNPETPKKRKIIEIGGFEIMVPQVKKPKSCFDLNLPLEETEGSENETVSETKDVWLEDVLDQVDENVVFDSFDFDTRAETILKEIGKRFEKSFGRNVVLEIENEVMVQILASDWASNEKGGVEKWIESVLYRGFMDVKEKEGVDNESVVKLVVVEGVKIEEDENALCVCLPSRIMVK
ncbi:putative Clp, repeat (R) domain, P-loop containing nucleoside triphosphate hydrolase [Helianthus debilis subsp. tardiflorus]